MTKVITTISSRKFHRAASKARRSAKHGPVFTTYRGRPAFVLMSFENYQQLTGQWRNIAATLAAPGTADIDFKPARVALNFRIPDLL